VWQAAQAGLQLGIASEFGKWFGKWKCLSLPGAGTWARGPRRSESLNSAGTSGRCRQLVLAGLGPPRGPFADWNGHAGGTVPSMVKSKLTQMSMGNFLFNLLNIKTQ
jgi:hypothetical protein